MRATILDSQSITFFPTFDAAKAIADANTADDGDALYIVTLMRDEKWSVAVVEKDTGLFVFYL